MSRASTQLHGESLLSWEQDSQHPEAGWKVKTKVAQSTVPNAGLGRFVLEDVPKGTILREATIVDAPSTVEAADGFKPRPGTVILFHNQEELVRTLEKLARSQNLYEQIANFATVPDDFTGTKFDREQAVFFWAPSGYYNHQPIEDGGANISFLLRGQESKVFHTAIEELFHDYREISLNTSLVQGILQSQLADGRWIIWLHAESKAKLLKKKTRIMINFYRTSN